MTSSKEISYIRITSLRIISLRIFLLHRPQSKLVPHQTELKDRVAIITAGCEDGEKTREMKLKSCWECCKNTYYATLCALLILIGCPMAAVGSQVSEFITKMYIKCFMIGIR